MTSNARLPQSRDGSTVHARLAAAISAASSGSTTSSSPFLESHALKRASRCAFSSSGDRVGPFSWVSLMSLHVVRTRAIARAPFVPNPRTRTPPQK